jgi:hypothetical protein
MDGERMNGERTGDGDRRRVGPLFHSEYGIGLAEREEVFVRKMRGMRLTLNAYHDKSEVVKKIDDLLDTDDPLRSDDTDVPRRHVKEVNPIPTW